MRLRDAGGRSTDGGFSLMEIIVAMVVLGAVSMAVIGVIMSAQAQGVSNRNRVAASNLASRELDIVRAQFVASKTAPVAIANAGLVVNANPLAGGSVGRPLVVDGTAYSVERSTSWDITGTGNSACEGGSLVKYPALRVRIKVTWPNMGSVHPVENTGVLTPDKDTGVSGTDSFLAVKVKDQDAQPIPGVAVLATGAGGTTGVTDDSGCAVIKVTPAAAGTSYVVSVADSTYIDISGATNPSKPTGVIVPGQIYTGASFTIAKPGSARVILARADSGALSDADVAGSQITLVAAQYSGSTGATTKTVTGLTSTFTHLWPTEYGAYFGSVPPMGGYETQKLEPGGTVTLNVSFEMATLLTTTLPGTSSSVLAVPAGTPATCPAGVGTSGGVTGSSSSFQVLPGVYDLYVAGPKFACSPGPKAVALGAGANDGVTWGTTTLRLDSVPTGGSLWALNAASSGVTTLSTCPGAAGSGAVAIDSARGSAMALPAGTWFVYQTNGAATGTCLSYPTGINPVTTTYGTANTRTWGLSPAVLTWTGTWSTGTNPWYFVVVPNGTTFSCTSTVPTTSGVTQVVGPATAKGSTLSINVARPASGTQKYLLYGWRNGSCKNTSVDVTTTSTSPVTGTFTW
ncbi:MAG: hypothetical protein AAGC49_01835 [Brevundimonas sp.]